MYPVSVFRDHITDSLCIKGKNVYCKGEEYYPAKSFNEFHTSS